MEIKEHNSCPNWPLESNSWTYEQRKRFAQKNCTFNHCCLRFSKKEINRCYVIPDKDFPIEFNNISVLSHF